MMSPDPFRHFHHMLSLACQARSKGVRWKVTQGAPKSKKKSSQMAAFF